MTKRRALHRLDYDIAYSLPHTLAASRIVWDLRKLPAAAGLAHLEGGKLMAAPHGGQRPPVTGTVAAKGTA
jgi:hypothetical protein